MYNREIKHDIRTDVATLSGLKFIIEDMTIVFAAIGALESSNNALYSGVLYIHNIYLSSIAYNNRRFLSAYTIDLSIVRSKTLPKSIEINYGLL
jgi:hypothetical protein